MIQFATLPEMLDQRARGDGAIGYLEGDGVEKSLKLAELRRRALGILRHLQTAGARPGDRLILHVASNEQFIDAYWACLYGGIVPVPVAVGISDEHKHKLLRIARQLGSPLLYTDRKLKDRLAAYGAGSEEASVWTALERRTFLIDQLDDVSKPGELARRFRRRCCVHPVLIGLHERSQGRRADAREHPRERRRFAPGRGLHGT
jgi:acyl-CoA synthetase (AMP-forming)/AMP-acid ligase II